MEPNTESLSSYLKDVRRSPLLSAGEEKELAQRFRAGDKSAGDRLVVANLRLVLRIARSYRSYGAGLPDLVQEGSLGLLAAAARFDPDRGVRLMSYAIFSIRASIRRYLLRSWSLVKVGTTQEERRLFFALRKPDQLWENARDAASLADPDALAKRLAADPVQVRELQARLAQRDQSLDSPISDHSDTSRLERLADSQSPSPADLVADAQQAALHKRQVGRALLALDRRERFIVQQHMMADRPRPLRTLAGTLGISRERVRQLECRARGKLLAALVSWEQLEACPA